jgi:energy-coupling factor transporter ATP-binding protein EcfA2
MENIATQLNIVHIDIEDLFGIYTYSIPIDSMDISKLLILYGNNGAGKTTILQMIFNLLSSENKKGYKTELANTKFKKLSILLSNGFIITAYRKNNLIGEYSLSLKDHNNIIIDIPCSVISERNEFIVRNDNNGFEGVNEFLDIINKINLSIHYLADDRKIKSNISMIVDDEHNQVDISQLPLEYLLERESDRESFSLNDTFLIIAIQRVEKWFEKQASIGNTIGQNDIQEIYFNLIENLLDDKKDSIGNNKSKINKKDILKKLENLNIRNQEFMIYNLSLDYKLDKYMELINKITDDKLETISGTINPYIEGIEKKLNAIEDTKKIINTFITVLNQYYTGKELTFSINNGLKINSIYNDKETLTPTMLSSGEKQLLLLFCNTITAREQASIFIIDEPELSLNVKWQRKLIDSLLSFSEGSSIQFILASHSIELLAQYDENVCPLENIKVF